MQNTVTMEQRKKKSEALTKDEIKKLKAFRKKFSTEVECAVTIGIDRLVLNRVLLVGSGSPDSISKIRFAIFEQ